MDPVKIFKFLIIPEALKPMRIIQSLRPRVSMIPTSIAFQHHRKPKTHINPDHRSDLSRLFHSKSSARRPSETKSYPVAIKKPLSGRSIYAKCHLKLFCVFKPNQKIGSQIRVIQIQSGAMEIKCPRYRAIAGEIAATRHNPDHFSS